MKRAPILLLVITFLVAVIIVTVPSPSQAAPVIEILDHAGSPVTAFTDGDQVQIRLRLDDPPPQESEVAFTLGSVELPQSCKLAPGSASCTTEPFHAFGWYWADGPEPTSSDRQITAAIAGQVVAGPAAFTIRPRPVVMVHGFISDYRTWSNYLGPDGFLASAGIPAYAVGDGQAEGAMNTGSIVTPLQSSNTIAQNAAILGKYIEQVKAQTGAENVDLLAHSLGGMISRFYIDSLMPGRDVGQLIMLGSPAAGTDCAILASSLGFYYPTILEIRSSYTLGIFNPQVEQRHGVPFFALAGTKITTPVGSPCTDIPNDIVISVNSVTRINLVVTELPILHTDMNISPEVFQDYVLPQLQRPPTDSWEQPDPPAPPPTGGNLQFTRVFTGHVDIGSSLEQIINLEPGLAVASFALYDPTRSLAVTVTGASGNIIQLSTEANGLIIVDDPETLVTMGYGFTNPRPGPWKIMLSASERTPASGADFALTARLAGGAELHATAAPLLPAVNSSIDITANLTLEGSPMNIESAQAIVRAPGSLPGLIPLMVEGSQAHAAFTPTVPGIHAIDVLVFARLEDGTLIERTAYLTIEAEAGPQQAPQLFTGPRLLLASICIGTVFMAVFVLTVILRRSRRSIISKV